MEEWKNIPGYDGSYQVSSFGNVRSVDRHVTGVNGVTAFYGGKNLKSVMNHRNGYLQILLRKDGKQRALKIHRIVLLSFVGECPDGLESRHLDGDRTNNRISNLEYADHKTNVGDRAVHGTDTTGEKHGMAKLRGVEVDEIRRVGVGADYREKNRLAVEYGVSYSAIHNILTGKSWCCRLNEVV